MKVNVALRKKPRIEMLPLIDIVFLLLVFFIYAMLSMAVHHSLPVNLPQSRTASLDKADMISVTLNADGSVFVNQREVSLEDLDKALRDLKEARRGVALFADRSVTYQLLFRALDKIRMAGLVKVSLQAEQEESR